MSFATVAQLYEDVQTLVKQEGGGQLIEDGMAAVFNANLEQAKTTHPDDKIIAAIPEVEGGNTRIAELLTSAGQLMRALQELIPDAPTPAPRRSRAGGMH